MSKIFLSVVIPCFDEMANLQKGVLQKVERFLSSKKFSFEVIIVDDGSGDGSIEYMEKFASENKEFRLVKNAHLGKAGAVTAGVLAAKGEYVLFTDMDQATPIEEIDKLLRNVEGYEVVIGSRNTRRKNSPWTRVIMSRVWMILRSTVVGLSEISDTQCGFKLFRQDAARSIFGFLNTLHHGYRKKSGSSVTAGFDVELLFVADKMGYKIKEVPVEWLYVETRRVNPIKDSLEGIADLWRIKKNDVSGKYSV